MAHERIKPLKAQIEKCKELNKVVKKGKEGKKGKK